METKALLVLDTWATSTDFKTDLINTMKSNGLNIITDLEATDIVLALNYMTSLIYSYYKNYYLSNASKERTLELMSITASGKLNFYASELKAYKDAYAHDFKSLGGNENSSSHDTTLNRSGKSKQATTPETIAKGSDYIDDYSSSEQKYENSNKETGTRSYNSTIKGSEQDYWKNIISIPKRLFEDIIGSFSKFFFSSSMELTPCAVLTIEQAIQTLKEEIKTLDTTTKSEIETLSTLIKDTQTQVNNLQGSVATIDSNVQKLNNKITKTNTNLENLTKVTPTDIGVKDNKLGLKHDTNWLTNQDAINLGDNLTYDETSKTLNAKGINLIFINKNQTRLSEETYEKLRKGELMCIYNIGTAFFYQVRVDTTRKNFIILDCVYLEVYQSDYGTFGGRKIEIKVTSSGELTIDSEDSMYISPSSYEKGYDKYYFKFGLYRKFYYLLNIINDTAVPKVLISFNNTISWAELPKYYEHDGMLKVNTNYIMFKYISTDSVPITDFSQLINDFSGNYITASGSFVLGTDHVAMVYGIDFDTLMLSCNVLDLSTHNLGNDEIAFSDLTIGSYSENVRLIQ